MLKTLGPNAFELLGRIKLDNAPSSALEREIEVLSGLIAQDPGRLQSLLYERMSRAIANRETVEISDLVESARRSGVEFLSVPAAPGRADTLTTTLAFLLQNCPKGLTGSALSEIVSVDPGRATAELASLKERALVTKNGDVWQASPVMPRIIVRDEEMLLSSALSHILKLTQDASADLLDIFVENAIHVARSGPINRPVRLNLYRTLEKHLKRRGNKHVVLEIANLSIDAARTENRTTEDVYAEAQALICGRSWVYQRTGNLDQARVWARRSHELGERVGWERNTAFCLKCIGRLLRLEADAATDAIAKAKLLEDSRAYLVRAVDAFSLASDPDLGPACRDVGDSYSLLGRTLLVKRQVKDALEAAEKARRILRDYPESKDFLDLRLLEADLAIALGDRAGAELTFTEVLRLVGNRPDYEISEIRARAAFARGINRRQLSQQTGAIADLKLACDTWTKLGEFDVADRAYWEGAILAGKVPHDARVLLERESVQVRAHAVRIYEAQRAQQTSAARQRQNPGREYWIHVLRLAKQEVAKADVAW